MEKINNIIDKLHFRTFDKVYDEVKKRVPTVTKKELRKILMARKKDRHLKRKQVKPFMIKIFSPSTGTWFTDLLDNGRENDPRYWHVFIGTNNRFAVVQPLDSKNAVDVRRSLNDFINAYHPSKITSDQEPAFLEKGNVQLMKDKKVLFQTVPEKNHSTLAIIDRFIRTLRDMNRPSDNDKKQSTDDEFKYFSRGKMKKLVDIYNNSFHSAIKCSPKEMFNDKEKEKEYIFKCMKKRENQRRIQSFELKNGERVRYVIGRDPMEKKRYNVSNESYVIAGKEGSHYILQAKDGTTMIKPRFQLVRADNKYSLANTIDGSNKGVLKEIISFDKRANKYKVKFSNGPGRRDYVDTIPVSFVRGRFPQVTTKVERDFFSKQSSDNSH